MPLCDSSETCMRAVRPKPSPAVLRLTGPAGIPEVSRFSCMKFLGVLWGLRLRRTERELALSSPFILPSAHYKDVGVRVASFRSSIAHPTYSPVHASLCTSRYPTQNSGPSGSLLLTRKNFAFSASCRFIPAHCNGDFATVTSSAVLLRNATPSVFHQRHIGWVLRSSCNVRGRRLASSRDRESRPGRCPPLWPGDLRNDGGSVPAAGADGSEA